jgi:hypothetical protein
MTAVNKYAYHSTIKNCIVVTPAAINAVVYCPIQDLLKPKNLESRTQQ